MNTIKFLFLGTLAAFFIVACNSKDANSYLETADCTNISATDNTYTNTVGEIVDLYCAYSGCHDATTASEGIDLSTYSKVKDNFVNGKALCTINHDCTAMPQGGNKLDQATINLLTCWVKEGAPQ